VDILKEFYNPDLLNRAVFRVNNLCETLRQLYNFMCADSKAGIYGVLWENVMLISKDLLDLQEQRSKK